MSVNRRRVVVPLLVLAAVAVLTGAAGAARDWAVPAWVAGAAVVALTVLALAEYWSLRNVHRKLDREQDGTTTLQARLDAAAVTSGGWLYTVDTNSRFVYSSDASIRSLGYTPAELIGTDAGALLSPDEMSLLDERATEDTGEINTLVVRGRHRNGDDRWFQVTVAPLVDSAQQTLGWTGTARQLTDAKHPAVFREIHRRSITELLRTEELAIALQPIIELPGRRVIGVEALSRFPSRPSVTPDVVFAEATDAGLDMELELLAVRLALVAAGDLDGSLYVAVNVSPRVLLHAELIATLQRSGIGLDRIVVEVTEHVSISDYGILREPRLRLRELGVRLAVDDAGSGYASLRHIVTLDPDIIKLDRGLITDVDSDRARRALVSAVVAFASEIGATLVVAEGVETQAELQAVIDLGVDGAQGFLVGRPSVQRADWRGWGRAAGAPTIG